MKTIVETGAARLLDSAADRSHTVPGLVVRALFFGVAAVPVAIGIFHISAEVSPAVKSFLTLHAGIGPYSGKVLFGYLTGLLVALCSPVWSPKRQAVWTWLGILVGGLFLGTALVFTPIVHWLVHLVR